MKTCTRCILPETFPGISFDNDGVCSHCRKAEGRKTPLGEEKKNYEQKFQELLNALGVGNAKVKGSSPRAYDVLMAYSGGKDSTYTMSLLRKKYDLRVLALSFDNGFLSPAAVTNIRNVTDALGVDHILFKPRWGVLKKIFTTASERELYSKKTLERASTMCTSCIGLVKAICLKNAIEQDIPLVAFGWSPGQAPIESSIMKNNPSLIRMAQQAILQPLRTVVDDGVDAYFLQEKHYAVPERFPYNVHPMAWEYYNEEMILKDIQQFAWTAPRDTDSNSSNCLLNAFANELHIKKYGFHPYVWEIANMVRDGVMSREEGYEKIYGIQDHSLVDRAREKLGTR
jgi:3'-phosphoadenosine 5'-phosphosulfate sulfotransferase (PAPS reductase)/FAD synthetase